MPFWVRVCVVAGAVWLLAVGAASAGDPCSLVYGPLDGWAIELCPADPTVPSPMEVVLDGDSQGLAAYAVVYHETDDGAGLPQVAVLYANGFLRLKPNADPAPPIPFGSSGILGPAYWSDAATYHHNPTLSFLSIATERLPRGPLLLEAFGVNEAFSAQYRMKLPPPRDRQTRLFVEQRFSAVTPVTVDPGRVSEAQGFKLAQISSMFINLGGNCDFGHSDCHDSDGARYVGADLERREVDFATLALPSFVFAPLEAAGSTWLDALHGDDASWQGNTPNLRLALAELPAPGAPTVTPQGYVAATSDPNDDNVGLWLHDDDPAAHAWASGQSDRAAYWFVAQDDPPEPWSDLGLRPGLTFLDMEGAENCFFVHDPGQGTSGAVGPIAGYADQAMQLDYDLGLAPDNWAQIRCDFDPPLDLSDYDHMRLDWRGDPPAANSMQVALISRVGGQDRIFARGFGHATHRGWWGQLVLPFRFLEPWTPGTAFDPTAVTAFFLSVVHGGGDDVGGAGSVAVDDVAAWKVAGRSVPAEFEPGATSPPAAAAAVGWLLGQQRPTGLLKSWFEEGRCVAHTYDQALAILAFVAAGEWAEADAVVAALTATQNANGSWFKSRDCDDLEPVDTNEWLGDVAWAIFALNRYLELGGTDPQAAATRDAAADWLVTRLDPSDGCLLDLDHTEGTIDAWWALSTAPPAYRCPANRLRQCLLRDYWDPAIGRIKGGRDWWQPYLDNQTWGAAFLRRIGLGEDARRALSFARETLRLPARGGQLHGFDGQGGPWAVWNEGGGQYAAIGGAGAAELGEELLAQQVAEPVDPLDGAMPGAPDFFSGAGVWTPRWHGVAPTAWLYFALGSPPFPTASALLSDGFECGDFSAWTRRVGVP